MPAYAAIRMQSRTADNEPFLVTTLLALVSLLLNHNGWKAAKPSLILLNLYFIGMRCLVDCFFIN